MKKNGIIKSQFFVHMKKIYPNNLIKYSNVNMFTMFKKYGKKGIIVYYSLNFTMYWLCFFVFKFKIIDPDKAIEYYQQKGYNKYADLNKYKEKLGSNMSIFILAWAVNNLLELIRIPLSLILLAKFVLK